MKPNKPLVVVVCAVGLVGVVQAAPGYGGHTTALDSAADKELKAIAEEWKKSALTLPPDALYAELLGKIDPDLWIEENLLSPATPTLVVGTSGKSLVIGPDPTIMRPVDGSEVDLPIGVHGKAPVKIPDMPACAAGSVAAAPALSDSERAALAVVERSTGRLATNGHEAEDFLGTAWVAGDGVVVTARHVVDAFLGPASEDFHMVDGAQLVFELPDSTAAGGWRVYDVSPVPRAIPDGTDLAVLRVEAPADGPGALPKAAPLAPLGWSLALAGAGQQALEKRRLAVVGYPNAAQTRERSRSSDPANYLRYWSKAACAYGGVFDVRRTSFGGVRLVAALSDEPHVILHGATAVPGVSGGPVVDVASGAVVGVHTCEPLLQNSGEACAGLGSRTVKALDGSPALELANLAWSVDALPTPL